MSINERIKEIRGSMSQTAFGNIVGATRNQIAFAEGEGHSVSAILIRAICLSFNVNPNWLLTGEGEKTNAPTELDQTTVIINFIKNVLEDLNEENRRIVLEAVKQLEDQNFFTESGQ